MWKVMAADDEMYMQEALKKLISWEKMGCVLLAIASDGKELLERMEEEHPDIVITDIRMPLMDGLEVCKYISGKCPETQVIILSAYSDFEYARTALRYNACEYVLKVSVLEELPQAVEKAAERLRKYHQEIEEKRQDAEKKDEMDNLYGKMCKFIEQNYCKKITLDEMAEELHANKSYLSRLYKSECGRNLFDDILQKRIEKAKEYILHSEMKVYEVSQAVGFEDTGYFSKVFKKYTGISPKEYKHEKKAENGYEKI